MIGVVTFMAYTNYHIETNWNAHAAYLVYAEVMGEAGGSPSGWDRLTYDDYIMIESCLTEAEQTAIKAAGWGHTMIPNSDIMISKHSDTKY